MTTPPSIEKLRDALSRITAAAFGKPARSFASIPARPNEDADLLLSSALDELCDLREAVRLSREEERPNEATGIGVYRRVAGREMEARDSAEAALSSLRSELAEAKTRAEKWEELQERTLGERNAAESSLAEARKALKANARDADDLLEFARARFNQERQEFEGRWGGVAAAAKDIARTARGVLPPEGPLCGAFVGGWMCGLEDDHDGECQRILSPSPEPEVEG